MRTGTDDRPQGSPTAIRACELVKTWPSGLTAVDGVDLRVASGEFFGLLGPNGAGKTTTIGMLTTRVVPTSGRALIGDVDVVADPSRAKRTLGVVPQTNTLDRALTVRENLHYHARYFAFSRRDAARRTDELLGRFRLGDKGDVKVAHLSGGMAQRLMLARALVHHPDVLFLDEPTAGLDPQSRIALWELLRELNGAGQTVLLTTHHMEEADGLCGRVAIMDHGRLLACDTPEALKAQVGSRREVRLGLRVGPGAEESRAALVPALSALPGVVDVGTPASADAGDPGALRVIAAQGAHGLLPKILATCAAREIDVVDVAVSEATLESVFIELTGKELRE